MSRRDELDRIARRLAEVSGRLARNGRRLARISGRRVRVHGSDLGAASRRTAVRAARGAGVVSRRTVRGASVVSRRAARGASTVSRRAVLGVGAATRRLRPPADDRHEGKHSRRPPSPTRRATSILMLGLPLPLLVAALAIAAVIGLLLSWALVLTTQPGTVGGSGAINDTRASGNISSNLTVLTESTLGPEVQDLVDTGYVDSAATFDVSGCLTQQGIDSPVLIMEEVAWGSTMQRSWLIVHTPTDAATLRSEGGAVDVSIVLPSCGEDAEDASQSLLWSGSTMLSPTVS